MLFIFSTPVLSRHLWQLKTVYSLHWCLICSALLALPRVENTIQFFTRYLNLESQAIFSWCLLIGFCESNWKHLWLCWLIYSFCAVSAVYRNRIVLNNIIELQNINLVINGMLTVSSLFKTANLMIKSILVPIASN